MRDTPNARNYNANEVKNLELMGVQEMDAMEMRNVDGGMTEREKEIWTERGVAFMLGGVIGLVAYELGRMNG
ncbi:MAG: hypothetical protein K9G70_13225 [Prolixibacteraceae bacterium]|nr:hypothetical protein [Prolixibacteraceae bacterium]